MDEISAMNFMRWINYIGNAMFVKFYNGKQILWGGHNWISLKFIRVIICTCVYIKNILKWGGIFLKKLDRKCTNNFLNEFRITYSVNFATLGDFPASRRLILPKRNDRWIPRSNGERKSKGKNFRLFVLFLKGHNYNSPTRNISIKISSAARGG